MSKSGNHELEFTVKVMNHLTGEVNEIEITSAAQAAETLQFLKSSQSAIKKAIDGINNRLDTWLGQDDEQPLANGMYIKRVQRIRSEWQLSQLKEYLDEDQLALVTTVKKTDAKNMLKELMEHNHVPGNAIKLMDENAIPLPSKPFIEVK